MRQIVQGTMLAEQVGERTGSSFLLWIQILGQFLFDQIQWRIPVVASKVRVGFVLQQHFSNFAVRQNRRSNMKRSVTTLIASMSNADIYIRPVLQKSLHNRG